MSALRDRGERGTEVGRDRRGTSKKESTNRAIAVIATARRGAEFGSGQGSRYV